MVGMQRTGGKAPLPPPPGGTEAGGHRAKARRWYVLSLPFLPSCSPLPTTQAERLVLSGVEAGKQYQELKVPLLH